MKSEDTEGRFELLFTRTPGYLWAQFFRVLHVHPIAVTLLSIVLGVASAFFFVHTDLKSNIVAISLLVVANWLDCADGQLARMTGKKTLIGRILDGFAAPAEFYSPNYSRYKLPEGQKDYRRTLYWNPNLKLDEEGRARVTLYNNSRTTQIEVEAAGQAADGTLLWNK